ncbi:LysR family transcriptional regulator [Shimia sagamensis]|uniref:DNA-binding transcriptional regulator, LysR family n=1 Tax=Shimia sagamensis TaxID=1566352 RepID=A0ABY1NH89_9RHOB|nr:LysR family transcriptional regulator [Shimia sagamensis]SMP09803.1 DNA-binding transcriptional regulator, LysR family [Shimia sagamensis]
MSHLAPEIAAFIRVVERGTFVSVATDTGYTSSGISRMITRLEENLGTKLFFRSTRRLSLTPEGEAFLPRARSILETIEIASAEFSDASANPHGHIRLNCGSAFANHKLAPQLTKFSELYPHISLDISVTDQRVDPVSDQADVTVRVGDLDDSSLIAIPMGTVSRVIAASPGYLAQYGEPQTAQDLRNHNCLLLNGFPHQAAWPFHENGQAMRVQVKGRLTSDNVETLLHAAVSGAGIIRLGDFLGASSLASGQLVPILTKVHDTTEQPLTALIQPGRQLVSRVRALLEFLKSID